MKESDNIKKNMNLREKIIDIINNNSLSSKVKNDNLIHEVYVTDFINELLLKFYVSPNISSNKLLEKQLNEILESTSRINRQIKLIKEGKTHTFDKEVDRLDVIQDKITMINYIINDIKL